MASGKSESSELAKRFCLRGRFPGGIGAKSSLLERRGVEGGEGRNGAEKGDGFAWYGRGQPEA